MAQNFVLHRYLKDKFSQKIFMPNCMFPERKIFFPPMYISLIKVSFKKEKKIQIWSNNGMIQVTDKRYLRHFFANKV